jgi:hypothetical protein
MSLVLPRTSSWRPALIDSSRSARSGRRHSTKAWWTSSVFWSVGRGDRSRPSMMPLWSSAKTRVRAPKVRVGAEQVAL